jgi:hypothetical protein
MTRDGDNEVIEMLLMMMRRRNELDAEPISREAGNGETGEHSCAPSDSRTRTRVAAKLSRIGSMGDQAFPETLALMHA